MQTFWGASRLRLAVPVPVAGALAYLTVVHGTIPPSDLLAVLAALVVGMLTFGLVRVGVDDSGVQLGLGPWGLPRRRLAWCAITASRPAHVGWMLGGAARGVGVYCVRPGPAVELVLSGGRSITVSVDDPAACLRAIEEARAA